MSKKKTHEEFVEEVKELAGDEYEVLGVYLHSKAKILMKHSLCNREFEMKPNAFLNGQRCLHCRAQRISKSKLKTTEQFKEEVKRLVNDEYVILSNYEGNNKKVLIKHIKCGRIYEVTPNSFLGGRRCKSCSLKERVKKRTKTHEVFKREMLALVGDEYSLLSEYKNSKSKVRVRHNKCGHEYFATPSDILQSYGCNKCAQEQRIKGLRITHDQFIKRIYDMHKNEYVVMSKYKNYRSKVLIKHVTCNNTFEVTPDNFLYGTKCPHCAIYKGEVKIKEWLKENRIHFNFQYRFKDCKDKKTLPFDFFLPTFKMCVEYDGEMHFQETSLGNDLKTQQLHDKIKTQYCEQNNIPLIRIPYWEYDNIEKILENELNKLL